MHGILRNMTDESEHNTEEAVKAHEADPLRSGDARLATVLQVLPAMEEGGGGVERGTVEIAEAITEAGGRRWWFRRGPVDS